MLINLQFKALRQQEDGVAAVEFALILPLLVLLFFGIIEMSNLLIADSRLRAVASSVSDLLTQKYDGTVAEADLDTANLAASQIMMPLPVNGKLAILTSVYRPNNISKATLLWTRVLAGGATTSQLTPALGLTPPACNDHGLPSSLLPKSTTSPFNDVMQVTAVYDWSPWFGTIFSGTIRLRSTNYNMPRYSLQINAGTDITPLC